MKKSKIIIDSSVLDQIANSTLIGEKQKLSFLSHIFYLTHDEQQSLKMLL